MPPPLTLLFDGTTWNRALRRDALPPLQHGVQRASGDRAQCEHDGPPFHGCRWHDALPLLYDDGLNVHGAQPLLCGVLRFVGSWGWGGLVSVNRRVHNELTATIANCQT